jgi:hypothetical protein
MSAKYVIGIDLGTTNSVLAYAALDAPRPAFQALPVPQLVAAGSVESRTMLPSFAYLAGEEQSGGSALDLPWAAGRTYAVGELARRFSAEAPDRTVGAAKSWLAHSRVDRRQPILPWGAPASVPKISPVTASQRYLEHLVAAWEAAFQDAPAAQQKVVLTVPASFDAAARELTREAATAAGLPQDLVLLEEPQAAVYAWLAARGDLWRRALGLDDVLLVCDVGGGTTDLTLVTVAEEEGDLVLRRMAVGNHLLVGGDNMDLALAHFAAGRFAEKGVNLDPWQSIALWHSCRAAKEALMAPGDLAAPDGGRNPTYPVAVLGRGSRLIGGTVSIDVDRQSVSRLLVDGFFPECGVDERPARRSAAGFRELGLPYETDTAITRHVAAFLQAHGKPQGSPVRPTHVLLNGGVFKAEAIAQRLLGVLGQWFADAPPRLLEGRHDLDHAVACGAAYYGWTQHRGGVRIRGPAARAYYVGIETAGLAIPGAGRPLRALCVVPIGMEEGTETDVPSEEIGLVVGESAQFRFFSSSTRKEDKPGTVLSAWTPDELEETDPLVTTLPAADEVEGDYVPVRFHSRITELGVLELWCAGTTVDRRWKLEFSVRQEWNLRNGEAGE